LIAGELGVGKGETVVVLADLDMVDGDKTLLLESVADAIG